MSRTLNDKIKNLRLNLKWEINSGSLYVISLYNFCNRLSITFPYLVLIFLSMFPLYVYIELQILNSKYSYYFNTVKILHQVQDFCLTQNMCQVLRRWYTCIGCMYPPSHTEGIHASSTRQIFSQQRPQFEMSFCKNENNNSVYFL